MAKTKKLISVIALSCAFVFAFALGLVNLSTVSADAEPSTYAQKDGFWMENGASLYIGEAEIEGKDKNGIRFVTYVSKSLYDSIQTQKGEDGTVEFGTLISSVDNQKISELTLSSIEAGKVNKVVWENQTLGFDGETHTQIIALYNFPETLFNTRLTVRSYVTVNGQTTYTDSGVQRSFAVVADAAIKDNAAKYGDSLDKYVGGDVVDTNDVLEFATDALEDSNVVANKNEVITINQDSIEDDSSVMVAVNGVQLLNSALTVEAGKVSFNVSALEEYEINKEYPVSVFVANKGVYHSTLSFYNFELAADEIAKLSMTGTFASSNTNVATVDENGVIYAVSKGVATITVTDGSKVTNVSIKVKEGINGVQVLKLENILNPYGGDSGKYKNYSQYKMDRSKRTSSGDNGWAHAPYEVMDGADCYMIRVGNSCTFENGSTLNSNEGDIAFSLTNDATGGLDITKYKYLAFDIYVSNSGCTSWNGSLAMGFGTAMQWTVTVGEDLRNREFKYGGKGTVAAYNDNGIITPYVMNEWITIVVDISSAATSLSATSYDGYERFFRVALDGAPKYAYACFKNARLITENFGLDFCCDVDFGLKDSVAPETEGIIVVNDGAGNAIKYNATSSNTSIVKVESGKFVAVKEGTSTLTLSFKLKNGEQKTLTKVVTVEKPSSQLVVSLADIYKIGSKMQTTTGVTAPTLLEGGDMIAVSMKTATTSQDEACIVINPDGKVDLSQYNYFAVDVYMTSAIADKKIFSIIAAGSNIKWDNSMDGKDVTTLEFAPSTNAKNEKADLAYANSGKILSAYDANGNACKTKHGEWYTLVVDVTGINDYYKGNYMTALGDVLLGLSIQNCGAGSVIALANFRMMTTNTFAK